MAETLKAFEEVKKLERRIAVLNDAIASRTDYQSEGYSKLLQEFSELNDRFQLLGGSTMEAQAEKVLRGLGFTLTDFGRLTDEFSGGWQMRILLARLLLETPDLLILDEPTNHLDIAAMEWLESTLNAWNGALLMVSHDRYFLDKVVNTVWEMSPSRIETYRGNYSAYVQQRQERWDLRRKEFKALKERLEKIIPARV